MDVRLLFDNTHSTSVEDPIGNENVNLRSSKDFCKRFEGKIKILCQIDDFDTCTESICDYVWSKSYIFLGLNLIFLVECSDSDRNK